MAPSTRFELTTFRLGGGRSILLSYEGLYGIHVVFAVKIFQWDNPGFILTYMSTCVKKNTPRRLTDRRGATYTRDDGVDCHAALAMTGDERHIDKFQAGATSNGV